MIYNIIRLFSIFLLIIFISCRNPVYEIITPKYKVLRKPITNVSQNPFQFTSFENLKSRFQVNRVDSVPTYYGGLTPKFPMAELTAYSILKPSYLKFRGGLIAAGVNVIIKKDSEIIVLNTKLEIDKYFLPIDNSEEAISYVSLLTDDYPIYDFSFLNQSFKFTKDVLNKTYVDSLNGKFIVHLFKYESFGCSHPYFENTYEVKKNGELKLFKHEEVFINPSDNMCVD